MEQAPLFVTIGMGLFFLLLIGGLPIGVALSVTAALGMFLARGNFQSVAHLLIWTISDITTSHDWVVMPLFILMGVLATNLGLASDFFAAANKLVGRIRGGVGVAVCYACAALGAVTGSTVSATMTMTVTALPELKRFNYKPSLALGVIASAATAAMMIPPSIMIVQYGVLTNTSIGKLLVAGIIPGLLQVTLYSIYIVILATLRPDVAPAGQIFPLKESLKAQKDLVPLSALMLSIIFGIIYGFWTPSEAASVGVFAIFSIGAIKRRMTRSTILNSASESILTMGSLMLLLVGSLTLSKFLSVTGITPMIVSGVIGLHLSPFLFFLVLLGILLVMGCFLEGLAMLALTMPILMPIINGLNWDSVWFGIIFVKIVQVATLTPPVGLNLFAMKTVAPEEDFLDIARGAVPFWIIDLASCVLLFFVPQIILWLPSMM